MGREKVLGATLILLGVAVAIAVIVSSVLVGQWRDPEFVDLASAETSGATNTAVAQPEARLTKAPKSLATTPSVETTITETTSSAGPTMTASAALQHADGNPLRSRTTSPRLPSPSPGTPSAPGEPNSSESPDGPVVPEGPTAPNTPSYPSAPGVPTAPNDSTVTTSRISGRVYHEVWGMPISQVPIHLSPSRPTAATSASGAFSFAEVPNGQFVIVSVDDGSWLSHGTTTRAFHTPHDGTVSFGVYSTSEALGRNWRDAASWRAASLGELTPAVAKVSAASLVFGGISASRASTVLGWSKSGTPEQRARAELLATWLNLATGRLGFDTRVTTSQVAGASSFLPASMSVLGLVRSAEAVMNSGQRVDWNTLRRTLTDRVLGS
jgi:hypothetical protein